MLDADKSGVVDRDEIKRALKVVFTHRGGKVSDRECKFNDQLVLTYNTSGLQSHRHSQSL